MVGCPYSAGICSRPSLPDAAARNPAAQPNTTAPNAAAVPRGCRLSGYECEAIKEAAIAAGLPVIDSRAVAFDAVAALAIGGPMVAVGEPASPAPWHSLSYAPLTHVAQAYRDAGAEVFNVPHRPLKPGDAPIAGPGQR